MNPRLKHLAAACILILGIHAAAEAGPIRLAFQNATAVGGTTFLVPVHVDSSLTGLSVVSYQLDISFNSTYLTFDSVITTGSMTQSWATLANVPSAGKLIVAGSGVSALSDTGQLVILRFTAKVLSFDAYASISFNSGTTLLNEGGIPLTLAGASILVKVPPYITVSPNSTLLTRGETQQFTVSGGKGPYSWAITDSSKATINASGLLSATNPGTVRVLCTDSTGLIDTSGTIEIRGLKLFLRDTTVYQGQYLDLPIQTTDVTGLGIAAGQLTITFNQNLWTATDVIVAGTILASASPEYSSGAGQVSVSFAGVSAISGSGTLLIVRLKATNSTYGGSTIGFQNAVFNEDLLAATVNGYANVSQLATIYISPGGTQQLVKGDSLQFNASGGTGPYAWSVSDSSRAAVSSTGVLKVLRGGSVTVSAKDVNGSQGTSATINLYDFRLTVPSFSQLVVTSADTAVEFPLMVTANDTGFVAFQFKVTYGTGYYLKLDSIITDGTLSAGWSVVPGYSGGAVQIAAASTGPITAGGTLLKLRFSVPDTTPRPSTTYINLINVLFNEGAPIPLVENGWLQIRATNSKPYLSFKTPSTLDSIQVGTTQPFSVTSYDPDGDALTYTWKVNGAAMQSGSSASFSKLFPDTTSAVMVTVVFADPWGLKDSTTWTFKVFGVPANSPPTSFSFTQPTIDTVKSNNVVIPIAWTAASDPDSNPLTYLIRVAGPGLDTLITTTADTASITSEKFQPSSNYVITGKVTDGTDTVAASNSKTVRTADAIVSVRTDGSGLPTDYALRQNYPNPFNPSTTIQFALPERAFVTLVIYDILGNEVTTLVSGTLSPGVHAVRWEAGSFANGTYFYRLQAGQFSQTRKLILLK